MKYIVVRIFAGDGVAWIPRTIACAGVEPLVEPTEQELLIAQHERALEEAHGDGPRRPRRRRGGDPTELIEAWNGGARAIIHGTDGGMFFVRTPFETINNHLDALNLLDEG